MQHADALRLFIAHGRWASSLLPGCFSFWQNVLRIILPAMAFARHRTKRGPSTGTE